MAGEPRGTCRSCGNEIEWWLCPNTPRCPHGSVLHDIADYEDPRPRCCVDGCDCGAAVPSSKEPES